MAPKTDLEEQIWQDDIERFAEDALAMWKTQYRFWQRAHHQGAPEGLLQRLAEINEHFRQAHLKLLELKSCFPKADE
jgi:hypothetical protein